MAVERVGKERKKALDIIGRGGPIRPLEFAKLMWPRAKAWDRPHIMNWAACSYLSKMVEAKLINETEFGFLLTCRGMSLRDKLFPVPD